MDTTFTFKISSNKATDIVEQTWNIGKTLATTGTASMWTASATTSVAHVVPPGNVAIKGVSWVSIKNHDATNSIELRTAEADTLPFAIVKPLEMQPISCQSQTGTLNLYVKSTAATAEYSVIAIGLFA